MKNIVLSFLALIVFSACGLGLPEKPENMSDEQYNNEISIIQKSEDVINNTSESSEFPYQAYLNLGQHSEVLLDYETAESSYTKILENTPEDLNVLKSLSSLYSKTKNKEKALEVSLKLSQASPEDWGIINDTLQLYVALDQKEAAKLALENFIENYPKVKTSDFTSFIAHQRKLLAE